MSRTSEAPTVDAEGLKQLRDALKKEDFWPMQAAVSSLREVEPAVRAATLREAVAKKKKPTTWSTFLTGLAEADEARLNGKTLAPRRVAQLLKAWVPEAFDEDSTFEMSELGPELLRIARFDPTYVERLLSFYEVVDPTSEEFLVLRLAQAEARGEPTDAWHTRLTHRREVAGIVEDVTRADSKRVKAGKARLATLEGDARSVFHEFLCIAKPRERGALVAASLAELLSHDWEPLSGALNGAVHALEYEKKELKQLKALLLDDERALTRLLASLETATNDNAIEPVLDLLHDKAGSPAVFAMIERAFQKPGLLAGELSSEWFRGEDPVWEQLSEAQQALVVDGMIAADKAGVDGAHHALFYISAPGGEARITQELEVIWAAKPTKELDRRFWSLIFALGHIGTDSALATIRGYAFDAVDDGVWECLTNLADALTRPRLTAHLLAARAHPDPARAHNLLTSMVHEFLKTGNKGIDRDEAFIEVARSATTWATSPLARFCLLHGVAAALRRYDEQATTELSQALGLSSAPDPKKLPALESRFAVLRKMKPANPFEGADVPKDFFKRWAKLLAAGATATPKGRSPLTGALTDEVIGESAGTGVAQRLLTTKEQVWFLGEDKRLHGVGREGALWETNLLGDVTQVPGPLLDPTGRFEERAIAWRKRGASYVELQRHGRTVFVAMGANNAWPGRHVLQFSSVEAAKAALVTFRENLPKDLALATDEWFVEGCGGVAREYYERKGKKFETVSLSPFTNDRSPEHLRAEEERILREGGTIKTVEWMERLQRVDEMSFEDWARERIRDDDRDAAWHLGALEELRAALESAGVEVQVVTAPGRSELPDDGTLPEQLAATWKQVSRVAVTLADTTWTFLSFDEAREAATAFQAQLKTQKKSPPRFARCWPLVTVTGPKGDAVQVVFDPTEEDGERRIARLGSSPWWEESPGWVLAVSMLSDVVDAVLEKEPRLRVAPRGVSLDDSEVVRLVAQGKWWEAVRVGRALAIGFGRDGSKGQFKRTLLESVDVAKAQLQASAAQKRKSGYR